MKKTVVQYLLTRLYDIGVSDIFGVAGDYSFPINDAICENNKMRWIGCCNELNAAYAADGYARIKGIAALSTTFGVGELSAINAIAGSYAEYLPIFHLVGMPSSGAQESKKILHHSLGDGDFTLFYKMFQPISCAQAILTPENCIEEVERLITYALFKRQPVYIGIPSDYAEMPIHTNKRYSVCTDIPQSNNQNLTKVINIILNKLLTSQKISLLPGILASRLGLTDELQTLINKSNLPYATMIMDKGVLNETASNYMGIYYGHLINTPVSEYIESSDCIISIGAMMTDMNTGCFTAAIPSEYHINIMPDYVKIGSTVYSQVYMKDVLAKLKERIPSFHQNHPKVQCLDESLFTGYQSISAEYLYSRFEKMFKENDIIFTDTGTPLMGLVFAQLPKGVQFCNQTLWGSIGWSTAAAFGAALAAPKRRVILITGEGAHQLTAQEICQFARFQLKPIIFIINNDGYLFERLICKDPEAYYNDIAKWDYEKLPAALGCHDWNCQKVTRCNELDIAINHAESSPFASYIEVVTDKYVAPELAHKLRGALDSLYSS
ncbi:alpha-keto acid decarboxylase family protein [Providencia stuartii]|uniref:alpha-keto acid decarboxylase family protein n=1 Tax=Providencia stuartii TaxID=588 RepID=UPI0028C3114D|nr:thiamine pyrophosphate-binding protein [Providencia stuartii]MDT7049762.1 thiamine pyrophosphate-binding protein [Providencia stuartii]